jgi:hypothetical protein
MLQREFAPALVREVHRGLVQPRRLHSALGYRSPMAYEAEMPEKDPVA